MKKIVSIFLIFVLCMSMAVLTGCGKSEALESGYEGTDFAAYITLPDYNTYTVAAPAAVEITDAAAPLLFFSVNIAGSLFSETILISDINSAADASHPDSSSMAWTILIPKSAAK